MTQSSISLVEVNRANPNTFLDNMRKLKGPEVPLGTLLNQIIAQGNLGSASVAAAGTVTIGGTVHAGDVITVTLNGVAIAVTSLTLAVAATGTFTVGGTVQTGDTLIATIDGINVYYELTGSETTATLAAAKLRDAINANTTLAARFIATSSGAVVTVTALAAGTAGNVALVADVGGAGTTTTLTRSGTTMTGGVNGDSTTTLATAIKNAINADAALAALFIATSSGAVVTITTRRKGTNGNAYTLTAAVTGAGATTTATASGATLSSGSGVDDILLLV